MRSSRVVVINECGRIGQLEMLAAPANIIRKDKDLRAGLTICPSVQSSHVIGLVELTIQRGRLRIAEVVAAADVQGDALGCLNFLGDACAGLGQRLAERKLL